MAVAVEMDFGCCGSGAFLDDAVDALAGFFYYDLDGYEVSRGDLEEMHREIQWLRPFLMDGAKDEEETQGHAWVVYGYHILAGGSQFLMNMGWGPGTHNLWYSVGSVPYMYGQGIGVYLAPESAVRFVGPRDFPLPGPRPGSPSNPYLTFESAIIDEDLPNGTVLILKAGTEHTFSSYPAVINKPLTLRGHNVSIK